MRPFRVAMCALAVLVVGVSVAAPQSDAVLSGLGIDLWPDYDRPGVLVIYRATIAPGVSLPARLEFRIPAAAGIPTAVAERQVDGQLITLPYERSVDGETALIEVTASRPIVQLEYYDPAIARDGVRRSFAFTWPGDYEVGDFSISVQQPDLAQSFTTVPEPTSSSPSLDGLIYHTLSRAGVDAGETVDLQVSYEKASDQLSVETLPPVEQPVPAPATAAAAGPNDQTVLIVVAAMFVFGAAVVVALMVRSRQTTEAALPAAPASRAAHARSSGRRSAAPGVGSTASAYSGGATLPGRKAQRFCTQCGAAAGGDDRFCHGCGTALKA